MSDDNKPIEEAVIPNDVDIEALGACTKCD